MSFTVKWSFAGAEDLQRVETWMTGHVFGKRSSELLGVQPAGSGLAGGAARIGIRYTFERGDDCEGFLRAFPDAIPDPATFAKQAVAAGGDQDDGFAEGARRILAGPEPISAGKLHLLGLDKVKAHFGDQWEHLAPRVDAIVQRTIERRLTPKDVYRKTGPLNYVLLFADLSGPEADLKCGVMVDEIARLLVGEEMGSGVLELQSIASGVNGAALLKNINDPTEIVHEIEKVIEQERASRDAKAKPAIAPKTEQRPLAGVHFLYRPIWDVRRSVVANFVCIPVLPTPGRAGHWTEQSLANMGTESSRLELDILVVNRVIEDIEILRKKARRLAISIPVHYESLSTPTRRQDLLGQWARLPVDYKKAAVIEILGAPEGIPQGRVAELVTALKVHVGAIFVRLPLSTLGFSNFAGTGVIAVGTDVDVKGVSEEKVTAQLRSFAENAEKSRLLTYARGLRSFSLTLAAVTNGFAFVDGDTISSATERPDVAFRLNADDLYAGMLKENT